MSQVQFEISQIQSHSILDLENLTVEQMHDKFEHFWSDFKFVFNVNDKIVNMAILPFKGLFIIDVILFRWGLDPPPPLSTQITF